MKLYHGTSEADGFAIPVKIVNKFSMRLICDAEFEEIDDYVF